MTPQARAGWYKDPLARYDRRYWDGEQWTEHVTSRETQGVDPILGQEVAAEVADQPLTPPAAKRAVVPGVSQQNKNKNKKVAREARRAAAGSDRVGGGTLFSEQVLVINQVAKLIRSTLGYAVYDQQGRQLGQIQELRRDLSTKMSDKMRGRGEAQRAYRFQVVDMSDQVLLSVIRPEKWFTSKSKMVVDGPDGIPIGHIVQETTGLLGAAATLLHEGIQTAPAITAAGLGGVSGLLAGSALGGVSARVSSATEKLTTIGHARFGLEAGGQRLGSIHAQSTHEWGFTILDPAGTEVATITKTWAGWAKERFTKADHYVLQIHQPLEHPLRALVVASALALDVALKQGEQTSGSSL